MYSRWLKNLWKSNWWWLLDLLLLSVEFHILERNGELSQFLSLGKRQEWRAVWLGYSLFCDQILMHYKGDVTRGMCMESYRNVAQYFGDYRPNGIPTNFEKCPIHISIHWLCFRPKLPQNKLLSISSLQIQIDSCQLLTDNDGSRQCLFGHTAGRTCFLGKYSLVEIIHLWRHYIWSPYKLWCKSGYSTESTVFGTANRCDWVNCTIQHIRESGLKGNWG